MTFRVQFHRYGKGQSKLSAVDFIQAESFADAARVAGLMRSAMAEVDMANSYIIASIATDGLRGEECSSGWETAEEFSARIAAKQGVKA